jgi:cysteine desulfurase / selenocysteine lyase
MTNTAMSLVNLAATRADFPALNQLVHGHPLVYLDNAATTQKPKSVIEALRRYYEHDNANVHRGVHALSERATVEYEQAREAVRAFVNARSVREVIFTRNATESINLVARAWGDENVHAGDEILITGMEHHSNIVPWQQLCRRTGATLKVLPIDDRGELVMEALDHLLTNRTRLVAFVHVSNALGSVNPARDIVVRARAVGATVLVDGSQAVGHFPTDVQAIGADFYVFTGHKLFGPTGIGVLHGREEILEAMPPFLGGGDMIRTVTMAESTWNDLPYKFEAGTPHIAGAIGLRHAVDYVSTIGFEAIQAHESQLLTDAVTRLASLPGVRLVGTARERAGSVSFVMEGAHPHDIGTIVDREGVAIRTGHHCAQPVMDHFGIPATARASFAFYNNTADVDALIVALGRVRALLG